MNIENIINFKNHPNIIFYHKNDKISDQFIFILKNKFNCFNSYDDVFKNITYEKNNVYYKFDCRFNQNNIFEFLNKIVKTNIFEKGIFYLLFLNFDCLKNENQGQILSFLKYYNYKFIIFTNNLNKTTQSFKSRCIIYRVKNNLITKNDFLIDTINYIYHKIFLKSDKNLYLMIKNISMILICSNVKLKHLILNFIDFIFKKPYIINKHKIKTIKHLTEIERKSLNCYYKIIYYEYSLLSIYHNIYKSIFCYYDLNINQ